MNPTTTLPSQPSPQSLRDDQRGAIVVMAVFMSAFLVGLLWYMIGIGDAIMFKHEMATSADAASFTSAVYHARGMNVVALLNIIMTALITVLVAAKILQMMTDIVMAAINRTCNQLPEDSGDWACDLQGDINSYWDRLATVINAVESEGDSMLKSLSTAQTDVAQLSPWVAHQRSADQANDYPHVDQVIANSPAMVTNGDRLGLPVMQEDFGVACDRAKTLLPEIVFSQIPPYFYMFEGIGHLNGGGFGLAWSLLNGGYGPSLPDQYCNSSSYSRHNWDHEFMDKKNLCGNEHNGFGNNGNGGNGNGNNGNGNNGNGNGNNGNGNGNGSGGAGGAGGGEVLSGEEECEESHEQQAEDDVPIIKPPAVKPDEKRGKKIWAPAMNGSDHFQVYGIARSTTDWLTATDEGVEVAAWGKDSVGEADLARATTKFTQAEYYYDQKPEIYGQDVCFDDDGNCGANWGTYDESVMWNLRWRARLREFREPTDVDVNILADGVGAPGNGLGQYVSSSQLHMFNSAVMGNTLSDYLTNRATYWIPMGL